MTSPTNEQQRVDVLQRMDAFIGSLQAIHVNTISLEEARSAVAELIDAAQRADKLVNLVTVRQVIKAGNEEIEAAGLNPWCINEGLADGNETIGFWRLSHALANVGAQK